MLGNEHWQVLARSAIEQQFPELARSGYEITSPDTIDYNCVAWAAEDPETWWWPDAQNTEYWPSGVPREETVEAFIQAYGTLGYEPCLNSELEPGFQKLAIYTNAQRIPVHVARQLPSGEWTSKLGSLEDIKHSELMSLTGQEPAYGKVACILRRERID